MTNRRRNEPDVLFLTPSFAFACALVVGMLAHAGGDTEEAQLSLALSSPRTQIFECEPLVLDFRIQSTCSEELVILPILSIRDGMTSVFVVDAESSRTELDALLYLTLAAPPWEFVSPGGGITCRHVVMYSSHGKGAYAFPEPGDYTIEVTYDPVLRGPDGEPDGSHPQIQPQPLHVKVLPVEGGNADAQAIWKQRMKRCGYRPNCTKPGADLDVLVAQYGDTVYGQYARFYLADPTKMPWPERPEGMSTGEYGQMRPRQAAAELEALLQEAPDFPLADEAMFRLAECYSQVGRRQDAVDLLADLLEEFPNSPVAPEAEEKLDKLTQE